MEELVLCAGDVLQELAEAEKLSGKSEGIVSLTTQCGGRYTLICC